MKSKAVILSISLFCLCFFVASGQESKKPEQIIPLYEGPAPGSEIWDWEEREVKTKSGLPIVQNVVNPTLLYYPADQETEVKTAMIIAPGGGFKNLMMSYEGIEIARKLNEMGVHAFVLKYRLSYSGKEEKQKGQNIKDLAASDGQKAVELIRNRASEFGFEPDRLGFMGFSAGGYVTLATVFGPKEGRPDFAAPIYAPAGEKCGLPIRVPENAPPLFLATAADDQIILWKCSLNVFKAWQDSGNLAELHIFQTGKHGFVVKGGGADHFMDRLEEWMKVNGWLNIKYKK